MLSLKSSDEIEQVSSNTEVEIQEEKSTSGYDLNFALKTLEIMYFNTNFMGLEEVLQIGYSSLNTLETPLTELLNNNNFSSMFKRIYNQLLSMKFLVRYGKVQNLCSMYYDLFIFGEKADYLIGGYDSKSKKFLVQAGTYLYPMLNFTPSRDSNGLVIAKKVRDNYTDNQSKVVTTIEGLAKSTLVSLVSGDAANTKNLGIFNDLFDSYLRKSNLVRTMKAKAGLIINEKRTKITDDGVNYKSKMDGGIYYCLNLNSTSNELKSCKARFENTLRDYRLECLDIIDFCIKSNTTEHINSLLNFIETLSVALYELSFYDYTDKIVQTNLYRNRIKHRMTDIRLRCKYKNSKI